MATSPFNPKPNPNQSTQPSKPIISPFNPNQNPNQSPNTSPTTSSSVNQSSNQNKNSGRGNGGSSSSFVEQNPNQSMQTIPRVNPSPVPIIGGLGLIQRTEVRGPSSQNRPNNIQSIQRSQDTSQMQPSFTQRAQSPAFEVSQSIPQADYGTPVASSVRGGTVTYGEAIATSKRRNTQRKIESATEFTQNAIGSLISIGPIGLVAGRERAKEFGAGASELILSPVKEAVQFGADITVASQTKGIKTKEFRQDAFQSALANPNFSITALTLPVAFGVSRLAIPLVTTAFEVAGLSAGAYGTGQVIGETIVNPSARGVGRSFAALSLLGAGAKGSQRSINQLKYPEGSVRFLETQPKINNAFLDVNTRRTISGGSIKTESSSSLSFDQPSPLNFGRGGRAQTVIQTTPQGTLQRTTKIGNREFSLTQKPNQRFSQFTVKQGSQTIFRSVEPALKLNGKALSLIKSQPRRTLEIKTDTSKANAFQGTSISSNPNVLIARGTTRARTSLRSPLQGELQVTQQITRVSPLRSSLSDSATPVESQYTTTFGVVRPRNIGERFLSGAQEFKQRNLPSMGKKGQLSSPFDFGSNTDNLGRPTNFQGTSNIERNIAIPEAIRSMPEVRSRVRSPSRVRDFIETPTILEVPTNLRVPSSLRINTSAFTSRAGSRNQVQSRPRVNSPSLPDSFPSVTGIPESTPNSITTPDVIPDFVSAPDTISSSVPDVYNTFNYFGSPTQISPEPSIGRPFFSLPDLGGGAFGFKPEKSSKSNKKAPTSSLFQQSFKINTKAIAKQSKGMSEQTGLSLRGL